MSKRTASHLRIHNESTSDSYTHSTPSLDEVTACLDAFTRATGWAVRPNSPSHRQSPSRELEADSATRSTHKKWQLVEAIPIDSITDAEDLLAMPTTGLLEAEELLVCIHRLAARLEEAEKTIRRQEAELATHVGVSVRQDEETEIVERLESVLASSAQAINACAAAIYLLDDSTSSLKMRSSWGLPIRNLGAPARPLRGALADLEALLGNAVMLEDISLIPEWNSPQDYGAAICVPIGSPTMPHGTLWFWSEEPRSYSAAQVEVANLAAGRIMSELERGVLAVDIQEFRSVQRQLDAAGLAQASRLPDSQPLHRSFEIDGWSFQNGSMGGSFHDWDMSPKEHLLFGLGHANQTGPEGALVAVACQTLLKSKWLQSPGLSQTIREINDSLWGSFDTDWTASLAIFQINPKTGYGSMSSAGNAQAFVVSHRGFRPIGQNGPYLAKQPDPTYASHRFVLQPGEVLVAFSNTVISDRNNKLNKKQKENLLSQDDLLIAIRKMLDEPAAFITGHLARMLPTTVTKDDSGVDRSLLVVRNITKP